MGLFGGDPPVNLSNPVLPSLAPAWVGPAPHERQGTKSGPGQATADFDIARAHPGTGEMAKGPRPLVRRPNKSSFSIGALRGRKTERLAAIASGFRRVLPPRLGGPLALLGAAPGVDLLLLEHTGFEGAGTFSQFWSGGLVGQRLRVRLRRFPANAIPASGRDEWLFARWAEMDDWIARQGT